MAEYENVHKDDNQSIVILNILLQFLLHLNFVDFFYGGGGWWVYMMVVSDYR